MSKKMIVVALALSPALAFAHPGHIEGFVPAFVHPFIGVDHLLMMLCVGIFAGRIGGNARWQLPLAFIAAMTAGWIIAAAGYRFAGIETGIAAGLLALGVLFMTRAALPFTAQIFMMALFALLHGMAHGSELSNATPLLTSAGFIVATALLHATGLGIAALIPSEKYSAYRILGLGLSLFGGALMAAG